MNTKRLLLAILAAFITRWLTDFLIHGVWMLPVYKATASLWRSEPDMEGHMGWFLAGQLLDAAAVVLIWVKGFAQGATVKCGALYGLFMGLFGQAYTFVMFAVQPLTQEIVWKWFAGGLLQGVAVGIVTSLVYKPAARAGEPTLPPL